MKKGYLADVILLFVVFIWGTTFVIVQNVIDILPPHLFNGIRFGIASFALLLLLLIKEKNSLKSLDKKIWLAGISIGIFLFGGYAFQTVGLLYTTASKSAFITGLSVIMVPLFSIFILKLIPKWSAVLGVILSAIGLYLLTMIDVTSLQIGDMLTFFCAIFFALQIITTGKYAPHYSALSLAWIEITVVALLSFLFSISFESPTEFLRTDLLFLPNIVFAFLLTAILGTAFAFFAQTAFQKYTTPTRVAIIFAMEPVFAALTSFVVQGERLSITAMLGGIFIFVGMILAELPKKKR